MNDWNIQARARVCQSCGNAFADKAAYHTLLFEQRSGFERQDICASCWDAQHRHGSTDRKGFVSHWQGLFSVPPPPPPEAIQKDSAESLLRRLIERGDPALRPASYILAVMLERKRILKIREQFRQEGRRVFVYELPRSGEVFTIADPDLKLDQLEQVQRDVARLLEVGLPPDSSPTEEPFVPEMPPGTPAPTTSAEDAGEAVGAATDGSTDPGASADTPTTPGDDTRSTDSEPAAIGAAGEASLPTSGPSGST
ncbi:MAG: hypothetical protein JNL97_04785 [Verrucomicrobiales bacterium]|nr:hypothetical protein [Verrucomicrobiales bacterium]